MCIVEKGPLFSYIHITYDYVQLHTDYIWLHTIKYRFHTLAVCKRLDFYCIYDFNDSILAIQMMSKGSIQVFKVGQNQKLLS